MYTVKGTYVQACENSTTEQNNSRTSAPYRSDCNYEHRDFIVDSSASLQMMSRNELISDEKDTVGRPRRTHRHHVRQPRESTRAVAKKGKGGTHVREMEEKREEERRNMTVEAEAKVFLLLRTRSRILRSEREVQSNTLTLCIPPTPHVFSCTQRITIAFRFLCCCHVFSLVVKVEKNLNGSRPTFDVRSSASLSDDTSRHTRVVLSLTSQIRMAKFSIATSSSTTVFASRD